MSHSGDTMDFLQSQMQDSSQLFTEGSAPKVSLPKAKGRDNDDNVDMTPTENEVVSPGEEMHENVGEDMKDVVTSTGTVNVALENLTPAQQKLILDNKPDAYQLDNITDLSEMCSLRGKDVPSKWSGSHMKTACVVATRTNVDTTTTGKATFIGPSIDVTKVDGKGEKIAAPLDRVQVRFHLDTQTPSIEINTRRHGCDETKTDEVVSTRLYAQDLQLDDATSEVMIYARAPSESTTPFRFESKSQTPGNADVAELKSLLEQKRLFEIMLVLKKDRSAPAWAGIEPSVANKIVNNAMSKDADTPQVVTLDLLIHQMGSTNTNVISFFIMIKVDQVDSMLSRVQYTRALLSVAARYGNFWFYRHQLSLKGMRTDVLEKPGLPRINFEVPRWLVTEYQFDTGKNVLGETVYSNPRPHLWAHHKLPRVWRNPDEIAFLLKMGIESERRRRTRNLMELARSDKLYFRGMFKEIEGNPGRFICKVYLSNVSAVQELRVNMPAAGTRLKIRVDPENPKEPNNSSALSYLGSVTTNPFDSSAAFVCILHGPRRITHASLPVYISYAIDTLLYERQMRAVAQIQEIDSKNKPGGIDLKGVFLNDEGYANSPGYLTENFNLDAFTTALAGRPKNMKPNSPQMRAIKSTVESTSGLTAIQGPPGTGKTETLKNVTMAMSAAGVKILVCAPTSSAVTHFAAAFDKSNQEEQWLAEHEYVHFTGACVKIEAAERLRRQKGLAEEQASLGSGASTSTEAEDVMLNAENMMQQYARAMLLTAATFDAQLMFGYKLRQRIEFWASTPEEAGHPMRGKAITFLRQQQDIQFAPKKSKPAILKELEVYEYSFGLWYLQNEVKAVFTTLSLSVHELLTQGFRPAELIVDEAARESLVSLATVAGAYKSSIKHIMLCGDPQQGTPIFAAGNSNVGHGVLSRNLFEEIAQNKDGQHTLVVLNTSYRCLKELLRFTKKYYNDLKADSNSGRLEPELQKTLKAFWKTHLRKSFRGSAFQVAIDIKGKNVQRADIPSQSNEEEADAIARTVEALLNFTPPAGGRQIMPSDIGIIAAYTGQVLAIQHTLRQQLGIDLALKISVNTTNHSQSRVWNVVLFSCVINLGLDRVPTDTAFPIGFVANRRSNNVQYSRGRLTRYIFGGLQAMVQMFVDRHTVAVNKKYRFFFEHLKELSDTDNIVTEKEWLVAMETGGPPADDAEFARPFEFKKNLMAAGKDKGKGRGL